jgi:hypothetical protein
MLALTIAQPKPLSSELNTEGVIDLGFHSGGANKREAFIYRGFSYIATKSSPPPLYPIYYK